MPWSQKNRATLASNEMLSIPAPRLPQSPRSGTRMSVSPAVMHKLSPCRTRDNTSTETIRTKFGCLRKSSSILPVCFELHNSRLLAWLLGTLRPLILVFNTYFQEDYAPYRVQMKQSMPYFLQNQRQQCHFICQPQRDLVPPLLSTF